MDIRPRSRVRNKLSHLLLKARKRLENEIREDFADSGEAYFTQAFAEDNKGKKLVIFDVGANIGSWAKLADHEVRTNGGSPDLHSFEPVAEYTGPGHFVRAAVSEHSGVVQMRKRKDSDQSSLYERRIAFSKQGEATIVDVPAIRLDDYIKKNSIEHIDLLKIDVEGHELSVLKSLGKYLDPKFISYIQFEYGITYVDASAYLLDMYEMLKDYKICKLFPHYLEETPYQSNLEDFMFTNYIAVPKDLPK